MKKARVSQEACAIASSESFNKVVTSHANIISPCDSVKESPVSDKGYARSVFSVYTQIDRTAREFQKCNRFIVIYTIYVNVHILAMGNFEVRDMLTVKVMFMDRVRAIVRVRSWV